MGDIVIEDALGGGKRVNRINYEICVLQTLRDKLRCKEVGWSVPIATAIPMTTCRRISSRDARPVIKGLLYGRMGKPSSAHSRAK
jgi:hypothetical protein